MALSDYSGNVFVPLLMAAARPRLPRIEEDHSRKRPAGVRAVLLHDHELPWRPDRFTKEEWLKEYVKAYNRSNRAARIRSCDTTRK